MTKPNYLTLKDVCFHFQRSRNWVYALKELGLPCYGNRFKLADVEKFAKKYPHPFEAVKSLKR
jgi:hypothetical protein